MAFVYDAIVIGAGLSGLQSALSLHDGGCSVLVLEAKDRVGGKTYSVQRPDGKGVQEMGAAWLNDTNQSMVWSYAEKFGLNPVLQNTQGSVASQGVSGECHTFPFGGLPKFEKDEIDNIMTLRDHVETTSLKLDKLQPPQREHLANTSFEQFCHGIGASPKALLTARVWCRGTTGQDPSDVSALAYLEVCRGAGGIVKLRHDGKDGAQYVRLKEGTQSIAVEMSKLLPSDAIELNTPVATVAKVPGDMYRVTATDDQIFTGRKVVVSVPSPAYKHIAFNPRLPQTKTQYTASARYGCFVKYICLFKTPFWRAKGACGLTQSFCGPMNHCRDTSVDDEGNHALTCFLCAGPGREWLALGKDARQQVVFQQLASLFATSYKDIKAQFLDDMTSEWTEDLWTGWGCPFPVTPPGVMTNAEVEKEADGVFFVGTEFAEEWRGYMEGALRSGKDGAERVLRGLGR